MTDFDGNVTTVSRNGSGQVTGITGPFGQTTTFGVNAEGMIESMTSPGGKVQRFDYTPDGLLTAAHDPNGNPPSVSDYDLSTGRLIKSSDPAGGFVTIEQTELEDGHGHETRRTTAMGRVQVTRTEMLDSGVERRPTAQSR